MFNFNLKSKQLSFFERRTKLSSTQNPLKIMYVYIDRLISFLVEEKTTPENEKAIYFYSRNTFLSDSAESSGQVYIENNDFVDIQITRIPEEILDGSGSKLRGIKLLGKVLEKDYFFNKKSGKFKKN